MHAIRLAAALVVSLSVQAQIPREEYPARRLATRKALDNAVLVLFGNTERDIDSLRSGFYQEANFYYLSGWMEPGAILLLTPASETLFLPPHNKVAERYTGRKLAADDKNAAAVSGFEQVAAAERFEADLARALETHPRIFTLASRPYAERVKALAPLREVFDAAPMLARQRIKKSPREIEIIERSTEISEAVHRAAWKRIAPGAYEYQVAASFSFTLLEDGCGRNAYAPIVGSGPNSTVLHYSQNSRRMQAGELLLIDAAAECAAYASDITRTLPVSGKFSPRQRELYEIVLGAQKAVIAAIKPGMMMGGPREGPKSLFQIAFDYINTHGKDRAGEPLGKYLTHGISHSVGLDVHDATPSPGGQTLEPGMVITVEPGVYLPEEGIGIRIEDTVLVTEKGARVLSAELPKEPGEIEKALANR